MGINFSNINRTMSQHLLNITNIHIGFQETGSEGVTEHVRSDMKIDCCKRYIFINHTPNCLIRDGSLVLVNEEDTVGSTLVMESIVVFRQNMKDIIVPYLHPTFLITFSVNQKGPVG